MYLQATLPELDAPGADFDASESYAWCHEVGHALIKEVQIDIGGTMIDKQYGEWLSIWKELSLPAGKVDGYNRMIGNVPSMTNHGEVAQIGARVVYVPLQFWFCRDSGSALPLIAMQYHNVRVNIAFRNFTDLVVSRVLSTAGNFGYVYNQATAALDGVFEKHTDGTKTLSSVSLYCDYVYLDNEERMRFARLPH